MELTYLITSCSSVYIGIMMQPHWRVPGAIINTDFYVMCQGPISSCGFIFHLMVREITSRILVALHIESGKMNSCYTLGVGFTEIRLLLLTYNMKADASNPNHL